MGSTIVTTGDRIDNDNNKPVFVIGAYRQGPVKENRVLLTTAVHPGEGVSHATGAGGEDSYLIFADGSIYFYGIVELDKGIVANCSVDYTITTDHIDVIPRHLNPGAYLRNIQCVDPTTNIEPDGLLTTTSGTAGVFAQFVEADVVVEDASKFCYANTAAGVNGAAGTMLLAEARCPLRSAYYLTDPAGGYTDIAYYW